MEYRVVKCETFPYEDQIADFNGLIRSVKHYQSENYVENYLQSFFHVLNILEPKGDLSILTGSDGRYYSPECIQKLIQIAAANTKIEKLYIAQNGIITTPAASCYIRRHGLDAGVLFSAISCSGGPDGNFGIKIEDRNGAPLTRLLSDQIYHVSCKLQEYQICPDLSCDLTNPCEYKFLIRNGENLRNFFVEVIDSVDDYVQAMKEIFDFKLLRNFIKSGARIVVNSMNGATGPYVRRILCQELGLPDFEVVKYEPLPDFGGLLPEPIPINTDDLFGLMCRDVHEVGFALGGDGQQYIVVGKNGFFVQPYDSLAVIAANLSSIAYYKTHGVKGFARSFTGPRCLDRVAREVERKIHELPQNWIHSANLLESEEISLAGEEDFSVGAEHCREKDGIWAILAWINILEVRRTIVNRLMKYHWNRHGRNVFARYQFTNIDEDACRDMMDKLEDRINEPTFIGKTFTMQLQQRGRMKQSETLTMISDDAYQQQMNEAVADGMVKNTFQRFQVHEVDVFHYEDHYDGSAAYREVG